MTSEDRTPLLNVHPRARVLLPFFLAVLAVLTVDRFVCRQPESPPYVQLYGQVMGTTWSATVVPAAVEGMPGPGTMIQTALNRVDSLMSTYKPDSELMRFNRNETTEPVPVSLDLARTMQVALDVARASGGAMDVTVWPAVELWGFGAAAETGRDPDPDTLAAVAARVGYQKLTLHRQPPALQKDRGDVYLDLSAVAKGYGVDAACRALDEAGFTAFLVEVGGELRSRGRHPQGRPWTIAVEKPDPDRREPTVRVPLEDMAAATSGSYRNFIERGGKRRSHIIDPRTLSPVDHGLASVTVLHPSAAVADAWATALMVLGPEAGMSKAEEEGLAAYFIVQEADGSLAPRWTRAWPPFDDPEHGRVNP